MALSFIADLLYVMTDLTKAGSFITDILTGAYL